MEQNAHRLIADLREGDEVRGIYRVARKALPLSRSRGTRFLALTLADRSGELEARAFDDAEKLEPLCKPGGFVRLHALVERYKGRLELKLLELQAAGEDEVALDDFTPRSRFDTATMLATLRGLVVQVKNPHVQKLLLGFLDDPELSAALQRAPAAKSVHHAFVGGLLEHTLSVLQLGWRLCDHYPQLDRDLVTAGCILHDLGKTRELSPEPPFEYTDQGKLVGHLVLTCQWIHERARRIEGFPQALEDHLVHLVVAHHGALEHGSPKLPQTLEALVVHELDALDSRVQSFTALMAKDKGEGRWTEWQRLYDRPLFKGPSWDGRPLPVDERRFAGSGLYEPERPREPGLVPVVVEAAEPPIPLPAPRARPPALWERPPPAPREYALKSPDREFAALAPPGGPRPEEPALPARPAAQKPAEPLPLDLFPPRD